MKVASRVGLRDPMYTRGAVCRNLAQGADQGEQVSSSGEGSARASTPPTTPCTIFAAGSNRLWSEPIRRLAPLRQQVSDADFRGFGFVAEQHPVA